MIDQNNFKDLLSALNFIQAGERWIKTFPHTEARLAVDFEKQQIIYPEDQGLKVNVRTTCNFSANENFVVFECVHRLLEKGYKPEHIELEPRWQLGHGSSGGRADVLVNDNFDHALLLIECKTAGREFERAWKRTLLDGGQVFSYAQQTSETQFLCLYASDFDQGQVSYQSHIKGDIIIEKSGGSENQAVGRVVLFDKNISNYSFSNFTARIRIVGNLINHNYLHAYLNYIYQQGGTFHLQSGSTGLKNIDLEKYLSQKLPLPPDDIQQQIVTECEAVRSESVV